jgi:hypothetical protein
MPKLTVHIGAGKTGSTAIQIFLMLNAETLAADGILVPPCNLLKGSPVTGDQVFYFEALIDSAPDEARARFHAALDALLSEAPGPVKHIIFSAENLSNPWRGAHLFAGLSARFDIEIVFYIRRQDEYLLSAWQQWPSKQTSDFWAWMTREVGVLADWGLTIQEWEHVVGRQNIHVRIYDRRHLLNNSVVDDFRGFFQTQSLLTPPSDDVAPRLNAGILDLSAGHTGLFKTAHDNDFYVFVRTLTGHSHDIIRGHSIISFEQRLAILSRYDASNRWIKQNYFPNGNVPEMLFDPPDPDTYRTLSDEEIEKQKWSVVIELIYKMYQKMEEKEKIP